ncbi:unnamed protein product [Cuscuta campestris]|uniref:Retrovirus-related Pol polyprotein from transposon TNT 1-94-like beta-barrel domain-containing protein n=1 Tax=Cuscuta campestris TaxID=132261 RepID=A0A484KCA3_9ASTE|nr:unnamed protein product [Cuscuta campestris]
MAGGRVAAYDERAAAWALALACDREVVGFGESKKDMQMDGHSVVEHLNDFQGLINQLSSMKLVLDDELQVLLLLSSLPESWETLVVSLSNSAPEGKLTMDVVKSSLLNEEARRRDLSSSSYSVQAHVAEPSRKRKMDCTWIIDSCASCHLTPHREFFSSYTSGDFGYVKMGKGADKSSKIVGMGTVCLQTNTGCRLILRDVRHVPEFRFSLISAGGLDGDGYVNALVKESGSSPKVL